MGDDQKTKKSYTKPELFEVRLDHEQAILTACSIMTTSASTGFALGTPNTCRATGIVCKNGHNAFGMGDSGPRTS